MDYCLYFLNRYVVDPYILGVESTAINPDILRESGQQYPPWDPTQYTLMRQFLVLNTFIYVSGYIVYLLGASFTYLQFYLKQRKDAKVDIKHGGNVAYWKYDADQLRNEWWVSTWSLFIMSCMTTPLELLSMYGYGFVYHSISDYGWAYFLISPILFLIFTDSIIYWIHRLLHHKYFYWLHKLHHHYKETTPFSAFHFHPIDGYLQGLPYHLFPLVLPFHNILYALTLLMVGLWTINIHDRVTFGWFGVNGAAHHTIHHTKFNYNYGQYFTFWDQFYGTYLDPFTMWPYNLNDKAGEKESNDDYVSVSKSKNVTSRKSD